MKTSGNIWGLEWEAVLLVMKDVGLSVSFIGKDESCAAIRDDLEKRTLYFLEYSSKADPDHCRLMMRNRITAWFEGFLYARHRHETRLWELGQGNGEQDNA